MSKKPPVEKELTEEDKIQKWLKTNKVNKIENNVCGPTQVKSWFGRRRKPQAKPVAPTTSTTA